MKVEMISVNLMKHKLFHMKSSGATETDLGKKGGIIDALGYIEKYLDESDLEVFNTQVTQTGHFFYLRGK